MPKGEPLTVRKAASLGWGCLVMAFAVWLIVASLRLLLG